MALLVPASASARSDLQEVREIHYQMGTLLDITIWHPNPETGRAMIRRSVREIHRLEGILSNYDPQSSISVLNRQAGHGKTKIQPELHRLLAMTIRFGRKTSGYFDVTVGPLMDLWQKQAERAYLPDHHTLARTLSLVGYGKLRLYSHGEAELLRKGMRIDLGGIGKGYAVDRVVWQLRQAGVKSALINFGGSSIYAIGSPPGQESWEIGLKGIDGKLAGFLLLRDQALSTSGSMGHFWIIQGKRYGHLINPHNGHPVTKPRMATVVAPTATEAEALTKPLVLLGENAALLIKAFPQKRALLTLENGKLVFLDRTFSDKLWQPIQTP